MTLREDLYNEILASAPSSGTLFVILSRLKQEGQLKRVVQECIRALQVEPGAIHIRKLLAESLFDDGLIAQAETQMERVSQGIRDLMSAYKLRAKIYRKQNRDEEALSALELYLAHQPDDQEALDLHAALSPPETPPPVGSPIDHEELSLSSEALLDRKQDFLVQEGVPDIATPTLAEVYFNQGQLEEAIETYEKVIAHNPHDEKSRARLAALRTMTVPEPSPEDREAERKKENNRKMIDVLEAWLANIRKMSERPAPV